MIIESCLKVEDKRAEHPILYRRSPKPPSRGRVNEWPLHKFVAKADLPVVRNPGHRSEGSLDFTND